MESGPKLHLDPERRPSCSPYPQPLCRCSARSPGPASCPRPSDFLHADGRGHPHHRPPHHLQSAPHRPRPGPRPPLQLSPRLLAPPLVVVALGPRPGRSHPPPLGPRGLRRCWPATTPSTSTAAPRSTARAATATPSAPPTATPPIAGATSGSSWRSWSASPSPDGPGPCPCWWRCTAARSGTGSMAAGTRPPPSCSASWWPCSCTGSRTAGSADRRWRLRQPRDGPVRAPASPPADAGQPVRPRRPAV